MLEGLTANRNLYDLLCGANVGRVDGVFSSGIYFYIGDKLLMLHDRDYGFLPFGIAIANFEGNGKNMGLETGDELRCENGLISAANSSLKLRVSCCEDMPVATDYKALTAFADKAANMLEKNRRSEFSVYSSCEISDIDKGSIKDIFAAGAYKGMAALVPAMIKADPAELESALMKLIGLGRGLTPSMDDFICGCMFVLNYARDNWGTEIQCLDAMKCTLEKIVPQRTNVYSAAYILSAGRGDDFSIMRHCIENAENQSFDTWAQKLLLVGGSSGADMLSGMCFAANYILKHC